MGTNQDAREQVGWYTDLSSTCFPCFIKMIPAFIESTKCSICERVESTKVLATRDEMVYVRVPQPRLVGVGHHRCASPLGYRPTVHNNITIFPTSTVELSYLSAPADP